jgi:hypothetical protein
MQIDTLVTFSLGGIVGYLIRTLIDHFLAKSRAAEDREAKRHDEAVTTFRRAVLTELEGIYPVTHVWEEQSYPRFRQSIPKIERAAMEFSRFTKRKTELDMAIKEYRDYCWKVNYGSVTAWHMYPSGRSPDDVGPIEAFKHLVEHLFSIAETK